QPPSTAPLAAHFPEATFVVNDLVEDSPHIFFKKTASSLHMIGSVEYDSTGQPVLSELNFSIPYMVYPASIGDTFREETFVSRQSDSVFIDPDGTGPHPMVDSIGVNFYLALHMHFDAWGTVQLPLGDFQALRQTSHTIVKMEKEYYAKDRKSTRLNSSHVKISYAV